jgi:DNA-binding NtrC family response regulator
MHGRTILVIDDNPGVRTALEVLLTMEGATVEGVETAAAGLARVSAGGVDLVIQDMNFRREATSGAEGIELFKSLRRTDPALPVVLLTAWTHLGTAVELVKAGRPTISPNPGTTRVSLRRFTICCSCVRRLRTRSGGGALRSRGGACGEVPSARHIYASDAIQSPCRPTQVARARMCRCCCGSNGAGKEVIAEIIRRTRA